MTNQIESYRYEFVHDDGADYIAYQRKLDSGAWQTLSVWMIPAAVCR